MAVSTLYEINRKILAALNIDPENAVAVDIHLSVRDLPKVVVTSVMRDSDELAEVLTTFTLFEDVTEPALVGEHGPELT